VHKVRCLVAIWIGRREQGQRCAAAAARSSVIPAGRKFAGSYFYVSRLFAQALSRRPSDGCARLTTPIRLPPGLLRLATGPELTGSIPVTKTIGIVVVAFLAAVSAPDPLPPPLPGARRVRQPVPAIDRIDPQPSEFRSSCSGPRHSRLRSALCGMLKRKMRFPQPIQPGGTQSQATGVAAPAPPAATPAAQPSPAMNSRRLIRRSPRRRAQAPSAET
jgi:hypothetical protein